MRDFLEQLVNFVNARSCRRCFLPWFAGQSLVHVEGVPAPEGFDNPGVRRQLESDWAQVHVGWSTRIAVKYYSSNLFQ